MWNLYYLLHYDLVYVVGYTPFYVGGLLIVYFLFLSF